MANLTYHNGVALSTYSQAAYIDMSAAPKSKKFTDLPPSYIDALTYMPWSPWGADNLLPQQMIADIESCGILSAIIDGKARFALCEGMVPAIVRRDPKTGARQIEKIVDDPEIVDFLEMNNHFFQTFGWMKDQCGFGSGIARFMLDKQMQKVVAFQRDDITEVRFEKENKQGRIENVYYSAEWQYIFQPKDNRVYSLPLLDKNNPLYDLRQKAAAGIAEHALAFRYPGWNKHYYSIPLWYAAYKWVKIAQGVPDMKSAMFENSMRPKYLVIIYEEYWQSAYPDWNDATEEERDARKRALYDDIDGYLVGSKNAGKAIYVDGKYDIEGKAIPYIEIKEIKDTTQQGEYLPDSAAANSEIAFSMLFNPAIIGASLPSGPYTNSQGGSNVREAALLQVIIHELERQNIRRVMNVPKYFNGWDKQLPGLEFIIPATIMTTLDTGAGSKPVVTGGINNTNNNGTDQNTGGSQNGTAAGTQQPGQ